MRLSARPPMLRSLRARLAALAAVAFAYALGALRVILMFARNPGLLPLALRAPRALRRRLRRGPSAPSLPPLTRVSEGIWRVPLPERADDDEGSAQWVVLHYTGTGESVHAAHENVYHLFAREPRLTRATHYVFEAPLLQGAYYGPELFTASLWERVETIVAHYGGPFVLVGVSRGGMVALDHGMRIADEHGKIASVLALSAPLDMPRRIPVSIRTIADYAEVLTRFWEVWPLLPALIRRGLVLIVRDIYVMLTALVLRHHGVYDVDALARNARDLDDHGVIAGSLRATREFRLLLRATERELLLFRQLVVRALVRHRERFFAALVWGKNDAWIDAERCQARMLEAAERGGARGALVSEVLAEQGHLLSARDRELHGAYQRRLAQVVAAAHAASAQPLPERDPTLGLRSGNRAYGEDSDE